MLRNNRGQIFTIIEILVVVAILVAAGLYIANKYVGGQNDKVSGVSGTSDPKNRALAVECMNNLNQIRLAIDMYRQSNEEGRFPASLKEIESSVGEGMLKCPVSGVPYSYDPNTGRVWCTTPGHGSPNQGDGQNPR
mgnify:CR=1 FL=1|jgi:type II secretory pathway pseudopilin PulG